MANLIYILMVPAYHATVRGRKARRRPIMLSPHFVFADMSDVVQQKSTEGQGTRGAGTEERPQAMEEDVACRLTEIGEKWKLGSHFK
jgi:hypothetical protein